MTRPQAPAATALPGLRRVDHVMGTAICFDLRDDLGAEPQARRERSGRGADKRIERALQDAVDAAMGWLRWVDETFSTYKPESQISRVGRGELALEACDAEVRAVLASCEALRAMTGGYFDVRAVPDRGLDPSGYVKGWSVERASAILAARGARNHTINAGGDIALSGSPLGLGRDSATPGQEVRWRIGVVHPLEPGALTAVIGVGEGGVATSGTAERGAHVVDPHTGRPATDLASVTVVGPSLALADAYATAALAMGMAAPGWLETLDGYEAHVMDAWGYVWTTADFDQFRLV